MSPAQRSAIGIGMLVGGAVALLAAAWIAWAAAQRWMAVSGTREALAMLRSDKPVEMRKLALAAGEWAPEDPVPALLAADLGSAEAVERLEALAQRCERADDRQAVLAAIGLARALQGKAPGVDLDGSADGRLIAAVAAAASGRDPGKLKAVPGDAPPHLSVLRAAHTVLLRRAWGAGKVSETAAHAGALLLLQPRAAEAPLLRLVVGACSALMDDAEVIRLAEGVQEGREPAVRALAALLPQRRAALAAKWPASVEGLP